MQNFEFQNRTKIVFGQDTLDQVGAESKPYGKKALYVYGKGSIKKNGVYDRTVKSLRDAGLELVEFSGVKPNPVVSHARQGVELAKKEKVDLVVAVGGGSVIDEAKAIAAGAMTDMDIWKFYAREEEVTEALPLVAVLTVAATGTEMNGGTVLTNEETRQKLGKIFAPLQPRASILDPTTTYSLGAEYTAYAAVDATTHLLESYFTHSDPFVPLQDRYAEGIVRTIIDISERMIEMPDDYQSRATFMWAATLAWNGIAPSGVGAWCTPNHLIGHSMSALYDMAHGASLSIALSGWMPYRAEQDPTQIARLGREVFDLEGSSDAEVAEKAIEAMRDWYHRIHSPTTLREAGLDDEALEKIAENVGDCSPLWGLPEYDKELVTDILKRCK